MKRGTIPTTQHLLRIQRALSADTREWLSKLPRPESVCGCKVPESLDGLTFGELLGLQDAATGNDAASIVGLVRAILKTKRPDRWILRERCDRVFGFLNFVTAELERIGGLFKAIEHKPDADEIAAGIGDLDFGPFGLVDWYARRMGITNHDDVLSVPWLRVYQCMKMDSERDDFERRLRDVINNKYKPKK